MEEMREALSLGYMSAKLKARPWRDLIGMIEALAQIVPSDFTFDADYNAFLRDVGTAVPHIRELEKIASVNLLESPLPQQDIEGNAMLRKRITRPIAMHYGSPTIDAAITGQVCDGFVIGGGAQGLRQHAAVAAQFNKPFFLQMVGTGLTTAFMLHFGATLTHATWPAITCNEILTDDLITQRLEAHHGYMHVPEAPGLGVELDEEALARYKVEPGYMPDPPRNLYRVSWPCGHAMIYPVGKRDISWNLVGKTGVWDDFAAGNQPLFHRGVRLDIIPDDGSPSWQDLWERAKQAPVKE